MRHFVLLSLVFVMVACHSTKQATTTTDAVADSTSSHTEYSDYKNRSAIFNWLSMSFDSLDLYVEPAPIRGCQSDSNAVIGTDIPYRVHIKANRAKIDNKSIAENNSVNHTLAIDTTSSHKASALKSAESKDTTVIAKPPDLFPIIVIIIIVVFIFIVCFLYLKVKRNC